MFAWEDSVDFQTFQSFLQVMALKCFRARLYTTWTTLAAISAMDYASAKQLVKGKLVAVVGLQKSSLDIAMEFSAANGEEHKHYKFSHHLMYQK